MRLGESNGKPAGASCEPRRHWGSAPPRPAHVRSRQGGAPGFSRRLPTQTGMGQDLPGRGAPRSGAPTPCSVPWGSNARRRGRRAEQAEAFGLDLDLDRRQQTARRWRVRPSPGPISGGSLDVQIGPPFPKCALANFPLGGLGRADDMCFNSFQPGSELCWRSGGQR
jgi:hypothetical protein